MNPPRSTSTPQLQRTVIKMKTGCYICWWHWQPFERRIESTAKKIGLLMGHKYTYIYIYIWWVFCVNMHKNLLKATILYWEFILGRLQDNQKSIFKDAHSSFCRRTLKIQWGEGKVSCALFPTDERSHQLRMMLSHHDKIYRYGQVTVQPSPESHLCINRIHTVLGLDLKFYGSILISFHRKWSAPSYLK